MKNIIFLNYLRGCAVLLVVWDHYMYWIEDQELSWLPLSVVHQYITKPLGVIQNFGFFGVVLFFLVSGYIITFVAQREDRKSFIIKRLFRIYPPLIFSTFLAVSFYTLIGYVEGIKTPIEGLGIGDILFSTTLLNFFVNHPIIRSVAWTLVIEMLFYVCSFILIPWIQNKPRAAVISMISFVGLVLITSTTFGSLYESVSRFFVYVPFLLMGQVLYYFSEKHIKTMEFIIYSGACYVIAMEAIIKLRPRFYGVDNSQMISFVYAYLIFVIALLINHKLKDSKVINFYAKISYSMYLNHGIIGRYLIGIFYPFTGLTIAVAISFSTISGMNYIIWRFIEEPSRKLARLLLRKEKKTTIQAFKETS